MRDRRSTITTIRLDSCSPVISVSSLLFSSVYKHVDEKSNFVDFFFSSFTKFESRQICIGLLLHVFFLFLLHVCNIGNEIVIFFP